MVKMEVIFKNGLAVSNIVKLHNLIKKCGGDGVFVQPNIIETQNASTKSEPFECCEQCCYKPCLSCNDVASSFVQR